MKHITGPWLYRGGEVQDHHGAIIARAYRECHMPGRVDIPNPLSPAERDRNMQFIAGTPDLFKAASELRDGGLGHGIGCSGNLATCSCSVLVRWEALCAAIERAEK